MGKAKIAIFMAEGCEEIEGLTVVDVLRRSHEVDIDMVSITGSKKVRGSHGIAFDCDLLFEEADFNSYDGLVLPGGVPGTPNLAAHQGLAEVIKQFSEAGKLCAAICAAPSVLGSLGLLKGKKATCYPGWEEKLTGAEYSDVPVIRDGNYITARGMGAAIDFGLKIVEYYTDENFARQLGQGFMYYSM